MKISDILGNRRMCHFSCSYIWRHLWSTEPLDSNMEPLNWTHPLIVKLIDNFYSFNLTPFLPFFKKERKLSCSWEWQVWFFVLFLFVWQIKISFLMVGHTQEDIDQMFSCISRRLSKNNAQTLVELTRGPSFSMNLSLSYTPVIEVGMYDVRRWLEECTIPNLSGHIHQHQFKLVKGPDRKALLFYKKWLTSPAWQPAQRLHIVNGRPKGVPKLIAQDKSNMKFAKMAQDLPKYHLHFDCDTIRWWERFIETEGLEESQPKWILYLLRPSNHHHSKLGADEIPGSTTDRWAWLKWRNGRSRC